jgi:hypothetical protein
MKFQHFSFGQIRIDCIEYGYDIVIDRGEVSKRKKKASKKFREAFGHTPLSLEEEIQWKCRCWSSVRAKERYPSWMRSNVKLGGAKWN